MGSMIVGLGLLLGLTWVWANRGFLSALLHMVCTIIAGAVAFGLWEPLALLVLDMSPTSGFLSFIAYIAWGGTLLVSFGVSLLLLRAVADAVVKRNVSALSAVDYAGAGLCGLVSASITVGIITIGLGYFPIGQRATPVRYSESGEGIGSLEHKGGLWIPADKFTAELYKFMSDTSLRSGESLSDWYPDLMHSGYAVTLSAAGGSATPAIKPSDFTVKSTYTVGSPATPTSSRELLVIEPGTDDTQNYVDVEGETVSSGSLLGVVVEFGEGAKEENGQVVMGNGQAKLVMRNADGETRVAHPLALISQADSSDAELYGRWMFDGEEVFIASVGGAAKATMALEFMVPAKYKPEAVSIKNTRVVLGEETDRNFADASARFGALSSGDLVGGGGVVDLDTSDSTEVSVDTGGRRDQVRAVSPSNMIGFTFQVRQKGGLDLDEDRRIERGSTQFEPSELNLRGERSVMVDRIAVADDVVIVRVDVSRESPASLLGRAASSVDRVLPPQLIDTDGRAYPAVGYIYKDNNIVQFGYDPAQSIRGIASLPTPSLSSSRRDQELEFIFRVSKGVEIKSYAIGSKEIISIDPPLLLDMNQN